MEWKSVGDKDYTCLVADYVFRVHFSIVQIPLDVSIWRNAYTGLKTKEFGYQLQVRKKGQPTFENLDYTFFIDLDNQIARITLAKSSKSINDILEQCSEIISSLQYQNESVPAV